MVVGMRDCCNGGGGGLGEVFGDVLVDEMGGGFRGVWGWGIEGRECCCWL